MILKRTSLAEWYAENRKIRGKQQRHSPSLFLVAAAYSKQTGEHIQFSLSHNTCVEISNTQNEENKEKMDENTRLTISLSIVSALEETQERETKKKLWRTPSELLEDATV